MRKHCDICGEFNVPADHEVSVKHMKNKTLREYAKQRKQCMGNRKGVVVLCNVKTALANLSDYAEGVIKISTKPDEEVKFNFKIENESNKEDIVVTIIQMLQNNKSYFEMNDHGISFGNAPVTLKPKSTLEQEVYVKFKTADIGQYEMPLIFSFRKPATKESIVIMRDVVVFVEERRMDHEKISYPYKDKEVTASKLFKSIKPVYRDFVYPIPKNYKKIYANDLKLSKDASKEERTLCESIREVFMNGVTKDNYIRFFHNLLWFEETIVRINLKKYNMSGVPLVRFEHTYALEVPGLAEKRPSLMIGDLLHVKPQNVDYMFEAHIYDVQENIATVGAFAPEFRSFYSPNTLFDVRFFMSRLPVERMHQAVNCITNNAPDLCRVFPKETKRVVKIETLTTFYNPLVENNTEQRTAVEHIVAGTCGTAPFMVLGPPGTGKTVTIVEAILQLVAKNPDNRIMVCTDSNMAADHVASMLINFTQLMAKYDDMLLLRANSKYRIWETLPPCLEKYSNGTNRENYIPIDIKSFMRYNIVITTLSHAAKFGRELRTCRKKRWISHLFIDEAAQASEPATLIPVTGLLTPRGILVLAGDPMQLGPVVISRSAAKHGLGLSLMERLRNTCGLYSDERDDPQYMVMLKNNFRSDSDILELPNRLFYNGQLRALAPKDPISDTNILGNKSTCRAIVFHGVLSKEQRMGKSPSYFNSMELEVVQNYIQKLIVVHKVKPDDIGVIAPYIRQVYKIKSWLENQKFAGGGKVEVGTVEAYQGKEKRVMVVSTVRATCSLLAYDARYQLGFLVDDKRFNVALTRAKAKVIVVGNPLVLQRDIKWRTYINRCRDIGTYYGYDTQHDIAESSQMDLVSRIVPLLNDLKLQNNAVNGTSRPRPVRV